MKNDESVCTIAAGPAVSSKTFSIHDTPKLLLIPKPGSLDSLNTNLYISSNLATGISMAQKVEQKGKMTVEEAGRKGGQRVQELIRKGREAREKREANK